MMPALPPVTSTGLAVDKASLKHRNCRRGGRID
jgi:hypothetical protein